MFDALRRMIVPIIIIVLVFFAGMIVLQWGLGLSGRQQHADANVAGLFNGRQISWQAYNNIVNNLVRSEQQQTDEELPDSRVQELQKQAWQQIIHDELMQQEVEKNAIAVTDDEVYQYLRFSPPVELQTMPYFLTEGKFDYQKYLNAMTDPQAAPFWAQIEVAARQDLAKLKVQELVIQAAHVTENEVREWFLGSQEKVRVGMVNVDFVRFSRPPPSFTDEELQQYFTDHQSDYMINERAALNLVLIDKTPDPADWEETYTEAMVVYDSIQAGADFAALAEIYSADPGSASKGGDLGWFPRGQMVKEFDRIAFQLNKGQVSKPVRTQFGWHLIKLIDKRVDEEVQRGSSEKVAVPKILASHILFETLPSQESLDRGYERISTFQTAAQRDGFFKAAEDNQMAVRSTGLFFHGRNIQYLGADGRAGIFAFDQDIDAISDVMENSSAFYVVQVAERLPAGEATLEDVNERVRVDLQQHLLSLMCMDTAQAIYDAVQGGMDLKQAAKKFGAVYETPDAFTRSGYVKGVRRDPMAIGAAFGLTEKGQTTKPVPYDQGTVIFRLIERISPDMSEYTAQRDSVYNVVLLTKRQELYSNWITYMVDNAEIENYVQEALDQRYTQ